MLPEITQEVLDQAINAFYRETGLRLEILEFARAEQRFQLDAVVTIKGYEPLQFAAEIKKWAQHLNFGAIVEQIKRLPMRGILITDYINPNMAGRLKKEDIQFIDTAGNAYIKADPLYIYVKGNKQKFKQLKEKEEKARAFTQTGLKVVYAFLCNPELVHAPYRDIAKIADVALGTVGWVIYDLKTIGFIIDRGGKKERRLNHYEKLLDRWVETYPGTLRRKQFIGEFHTDNPYWWNEIGIEKYDAYWGGEIAGAKYTKFLKPEIATVYIPAAKEKNLIQDARLYKAKDRNYNIARIYRKFWQQPKDYTGLVHPVLAYADLIATGDARNIETANIIKDKYFDKYIREN